MIPANDPITLKETFTLSSVGINPTPSTNIIMESGKYICVREEPSQNSVEIIDMSMPGHPLRRSMAVHSAIMNPISPIVALNAIHGTTQNHMQMFNIETNVELKSHQMPEWVVFWKWLTPKLLAMATKTSMYHWSIEGDSEPVKIFDRTDNIPNNRFVDYKCDPSEKWLLLIGLAPPSPERPRLNRGNVQLYSVDQQRCQALEATRASFASFKVGGILPPSLLLCLATKSYNAGQVTSKLHISELGARPGESSYSERESNFVYPPGYEDDVPVGMEISQKYGLIYVVTMCGLLYVCDLESSTILYLNRISTYPIVMSCEAASVGGIYVVNRRCDVLLVTVNESTILPYVSGELNNLELAVNLAKRGNIPGAENLFVQRFQELFAQAKYKEAALIAADSPQDILRTPDTFAKFKRVRAQTGQIPPVLLYSKALLQKGKLNAFESLELFRIVVNPNWIYILEKWLAEDKVECTEELGDVVKRVDKNLALEIYIKARATRKVVAAYTERKEFDKILIYSNEVGYAPDYLFLLQTILQSDPQEAVNFALMMAKMDGGCPVDYNTITDVFIQKNLIHEATTFLMDVLKPDLPEHAHLQTKVLEINLVTFPDVANAILANGMFSHYDRARIAQLRDTAGLNGIREGVA